MNGLERFGKYGHAQGLRSVVRGELGGIEQVVMRRERWASSSDLAFDVNLAESFGPRRFEQWSGFAGQQSDVL